MKKIIDGRMYNTDTATCVATYDNGCSYDDLDYISEDLFIKKNGEWFIYGAGGARTNYSVSCGSNWWRGGSSIIPLTEEEAKEWLEEHDFVDEYIKYFGEPEE